MTTRRNLAMTAAAPVPLASGAGPALAQTAQAPAAARASGQADFLFVHSARRMRFDRAAGRLTLHDVSPPSP
jgi:hypothetical protein